jgi:hypothetical protein
MFPEGHGLHPGHHKLRGHLRFINLDTGAFLRVRLPIFTKHSALNPLTGDLADLPPLSTLQASTHS